MFRFLKSMTIVAAMTVVAAPAQASDAWAAQIAKGAKFAEKQVSLGRERAASLGIIDLSKANLVAKKPSAQPFSTDDLLWASQTRAASLKSSKSERSRKSRDSLSGGSVNWTADADCLDGTLRGIIRRLASNYGPVTVNSTCRSRSRNASVGGAPKSYHLKGEAVDFRVHSNVSAVYASLRDNGNVGGLKHYGGGLFHIDTGPRRSW